MILGVTPARGGSKSIHRKNIKELCGKPLVAWTIEAARQSKLLDRYVVSTEDKEIAQIAEKYGAEVVERPPELATDEASTLSVLQDVLGKIDADVVVVLQATSPIREPGGFWILVLTLWQPGSSVNIRSTLPRGYVGRTSMVSSMMMATYM